MREMGNKNAYRGWELLDVKQGDRRITRAKMCASKRQMFQGTVLEIAYTDSPDVKPAWDDAPFFWKEHGRWHRTK